MASLILRLPDFCMAFIIEADASGTGIGIGVVLMQKGQPIAFIGKTLNYCNQSKSMYEKDLLVVLYVVFRWHHYLEGVVIMIKSDQQSLKHFLEQKVTTMLQRVLKLIGPDYFIQCENRVVDALSHHMDDENTA